MILDKAWGICGMTSDVMPAARIFLQLIADFARLSRSAHPAKKGDRR